CDGIVLATGAWGAESSRWLHCPIPIKPLKGDLLIVKTAEGPPIRHNYAWRDAAVYGTGSPEFWLGGTEEEAGFDCVPTAAARESILSRAAHLFLRLKDAVVVQQISGLRPMTADDLPLAGFAPGWKNVCLAMGGGRKGMLYSAGVGRAVAELLAKGQTDMPIAGCSPARLTKV
ncbi:FAD-dependent oxidoreductase, partial [Candidatus Sumerlaeota bacterium]|nr:FAD-dependent oxidoreductase [Candidatus Sumerlaeota bacterium]